MFERFTTAAREVVVTAQTEARALRHPFIGTEHVLLGLAADQGLAGTVLREAGITAGHLRDDLRRATSGDLDADALRTIGIDLDDVRRSVEESFGPGALEQPSTIPRRRGLLGRRAGHPSGHLPFTERAKKVLQLALREAVQLHSGTLGSEHLLLGVLREGQGLGVRLLTTRGVDLSRLRRELLERSRRSA